jgi:hypothetical protein
MRRGARISVWLIALLPVWGGCGCGNDALLLNESHGRFHFTLMRRPVVGTSYEVMCTGTLKSDHTQYWDTHVLMRGSNATERIQFRIREVRPHREFIIVETSRPNTVLGHYVAFGDGEAHYTYPLDVTRRGLSSQELEQRILGLRKSTGDQQLQYGVPPERPQQPPP